MKVVILAGGLGTRLAEETHIRPKPMVEIGGYPILWHIMKIYSAYGFNEFIICLGYKGYVIKEYFANYLMHQSDLTIDVAAGRLDYHRNGAESWRVTLVDTGAETMTGGRLRRIRHHLNPSEPFCMTYGDGVSDINVADLVAFHKKSGLEATLTAVRPPGRYGATKIQDGRVTAFVEKPAGDGGYINGGFFVLHPAVLARIDGDETAWEWDPMTRLAGDGKLAAYRHDGFWQAMDTLRDKTYLDALWRKGEAPWKVWD